VEGCTLSSKVCGLWDLPVQLRSPSLTCPSATNPASSYPRTLLYPRVVRSYLSPVFKHGSRSTTETHHVLPTYGAGRIRRWEMLLKPAAIRPWRRFRLNPWSLTRFRPKMFLTSAFLLHQEEIENQLPYKFLGCRDFTRTPCCWSSCRYS